MLLDMLAALQISLLIGLLVILPALCAGVLRLAGAPGWSVLGGVMAGLVLGPTILGRVAPSAHESLFVGGTAQRETIERLDSLHGADLIAAETGDLDDPAREELQRSYAQQRNVLEVQLTEARWAHQQPLRALTIIMVAAALIGAAGFAVPKPPIEGQRQHAVSIISIGIWSAALPGAIAFVAATRWWGWPASEAAIVAGAVMIGPWALTQIDREAADRAEHGGARLIQSSGRVASALALIAIAWGLTSELGLAAGLVWCAALGSLLVGWLLTGMLSARTTLRSVIVSIAIPSLAALAAMRIELFDHFAIWPVLVLLILSGDGRWFGTFLGAMSLGGRGMLRTMRLVLGSMSCGPTQLAVVALAAHLWTIPGKAILALVLGAVVIEATAPLRRSMAKRLSEAEEWELD